MYKPIIYANNFGLYINSQQKINMDIYIRWTSITISHSGPNLPYLNTMSDEHTQCASNNKLNVTAD